ncbi:MAG: hypothetical protein RBT80_18890 [Candidatus Vecturithrix sp.]|nr:hypothetical protein [Candidatus Vecturithrix sp.]
MESRRDAIRITAEEVTIAHLRMMPSVWIHWPPRIKRGEMLSHGFRSHFGPHSFYRYHRRQSQIFLR